MTAIIDEFDVFNDDVVTLLATNKMVSYCDTLGNEIYIVADSDPMSVEISFSCKLVLATGLWRRNCGGKNFIA